EEQQQIVFQVVQCLRADPQRARLDLAARQELETRQPAVGRDVLVLFADRLLQPVDLDVAGLLGQLFGMYEVFFVRVQGLEQGSGETARRAQAGAGGDVCHAGDFQSGNLDTYQPQRLAQNGVVDLVEAVDSLKFGIFDDKFRHERLMQGDAHI